MAGLLPANILEALRSLRGSYTHQRQLLDGQPGAHASSGLRRVDQLIAAIDQAMVTGEAPIQQLSSALRSSGKFLSHPVAHLSRGEMVKLLAIGGGTTGAPNRGWWQVQTRSGITGWIDRKELFPDAPSALSSLPGTAGRAGQPEEIELGVRDTMIR